MFINNKDVSAQAKILILNLEFTSLHCPLNDLYRFTVQNRKKTKHVGRNILRKEASSECLLVLTINNCRSLFV